MRYIRLQKINAIDSPDFPSGDPAVYPYGKMCLGHSLPLQYELEGWLLAAPVVWRES